MNGDFQNPNEDPGLQKRLILVFAITFAIILVTQPLLRKFAPQLVEKPKEEQQQNQPAAGGGQPAASSGQPAASAQPGSAASSSKQAAARTPVPPVENKQAAGEREVVVENDLYKITFTNRGAQVKSWILKRFKDNQGHPLELVNKYGAETAGYPLSLWAYDETLRNQLNSALYVREEGSDAGIKTAPADLTFEYAAGDLSVRKSFHFGHSYEVRVETEVTRGGANVTAYPAWPGGFGDSTNPASYGAERIDYQYANNIERLAAKKASGGATIAGPFHWAGVIDQYFAAIFLPDDPQHVAMITLHNQASIPEDPAKPDPNKTIKVSVLGAAVGNPNGKTSARLYVGPKAVDVLQSVHAANEGPNLEGALDFGYFGFISKPLFLWLKWTQEHWTSNWGWAIIVLTVIINAALFPLRLSSMKSALKMQKVAPQVKAIQERYKKFKLNDPRRAAQNDELQALYKEHGVNPVGGCFPVLLQMPFLFAFYSMLGNSIELRHAHWLWIHDLAAPDTLHLLPIGIIITMFFTQRFTPQAGMDPMQQRMMAVMMPVMMGVISWNLSSGLGLYWAVGNLIGLAQQIWMNNTEFGRQVRAHAEERARKPRK
ncbi:MAG: membrane protein insertase YidC [Acidobacteriota bacterium]|nr:membrane protein insertase YidC [Acidobacteriota bacterium]